MFGAQASTGPRSITLDQLVAFNDEIASLVKIGLPLELGLVANRDELPKSMNDINLALATRMNRGESLADAMASEAQLFPPAYRAAVQAGVQAGDLGAVLESISRFARSVIDLRTNVGMAFLYPFIVVSLAYVMFVLLLTEFVGRFRDVTVDLHLPISAPLAFLVRLSETLVYWGWIPPLAMVLLLLWWWIGNRAQGLNLTGFSTPLACVPGIGRLARNFRDANFAELLSILVEHRVPLDQAIVLAADATGDKSLQRTARNIAGAIERGDPPPAVTGISPFLQWLLTQSPRQLRLAESLRHAATTYRQRAINQAAWIKLGTPIVAGILVGGGATMLYALTLFSPFLALLKEVGSP